MLPCSYSYTSPSRHSRPHPAGQTMHQALPSPRARVVLSLLIDAPPSQHRPAHRHHPRLTDYAVMLLLLHQPLSALTPTPRRLNDAPGPAQPACEGRPNQAVRSIPGGHGMEGLPPSWPLHRVMASLWSPRVQVRPSRVLHGSEPWALASREAVRPPRAPPGRPESQLEPPGGWGRQRCR
jgi:hypothetical protein